MACCFGDEIERLGSLSAVLSDTYRRHNLERVNAEKIVDAWAFVVPPLRTDGSLLDSHGAALRLAGSHPEMPAVTATDLEDAFRNTTVPEYGGWTEDSGLPFGSLLSPSAHVFPDENTPVGQAQLRVAESLGAEVHHAAEAGAVRAARRLLAETYVDEVAGLELARININAVDASGRNARQVNGAGWWAKLYLKE